MYLNLLNHCGLFLLHNPTLLSFSACHQIHLTCSPSPLISLPLPKLAQKYIYQSSSTFVCPLSHAFGFCSVFFFQLLYILSIIKLSKANKLWICFFDNQNVGHKDQHNHLLTQVFSDHLMRFSVWYSGAKLRVHCAQVEGEAKPDVPIKQISVIMLENCVLDTAL